MRLRGRVLGLCVAAGVMALGGCRGTSPGPPSPYLGRWAGAYTDVGNSDSGLLDVTVLMQGETQGTFTDAGSGASGTVSGSVDDAGYVQVTVAPPARADASLVGHVSIDARGHLLGILSERVGGKSVGTLSLDLAKQ